MGAEVVGRGAEFEAAVREEWMKALEHAEIDAEAARLWFGRGPHDLQAGANYYVPVKDIDGEHGLDERQWADAHTDEIRELHRVVIYPDSDWGGEAEGVAPETVIPIFGAFLRHELQHALQWEAVGSDVLNIDDALIAPVLVEKFNGFPGSAGAYNAKPMEQDANAAASMFLREHHPDLVDTIMQGPSSQLVQSLTPPEDPATLGERMVCFLFTYRDVCDRWSAPIAFRHRVELFDDEGRGLVELWDRLCEGPAAAGEEDDG